MGDVYVYNHIPHIKCTLTFLICFELFYILILLASTGCIKDYTLCCTCGEENQLDDTQWFIDLVISSTCFGHLHASRQELETILRL
jgi:hypothetical protein